MSANPASKEIMDSLQNTGVGKKTKQNCHGFLRQTVTILSFSEQEINVSHLKMDSSLDSV